MKYPNLTSSKIISFDIETYDPFLKEKGPGVYREDGRILGVAIADEKGFAEYYNISHIDCTYEERQKNLNYLKDVFAIDNFKLGTNILYDMDWLQNGYGIKINGKLRDIQIAEPLLDEYKKSYSLDNLAKEYLGKEKFKTEIEEFCEKYNLKGDSRKHLYLMPYELVKKYAIEDVLLPIEIYKKQYTRLKEENLFDLFNMEMDLFPLLLQMRKTGVRINVDLLEKTKIETEKDIKRLTENLYKNYGEFNYNSSQQIAKIFDSLNISYKLTEKENPIMDKKFLSRVDHQIVRDILEVKHLKKIYSTYLCNYFTDLRIGDRLHCSFFPLRNDKYGTKSGRFSSANPNLQNIVKDSEKDPIGYRCRELFIPEDDHDWGKIDYSQIEYRIIAHYATGPKSDEIRKQYNEDPKTDYHKFVMGLTGFDRKIAKSLNFGVAYCMGIARCADTFNWSLEDSKKFIDIYHNAVPFVKYTSRQVSNVAKGRGYIRTILNRRARMNETMRAEGKEYTMFNRLMQGSAADIFKKAMLDCYKAGIFDVLKLHLIVHDEKNVSIPKTKEGIQAFREMKHLMEDAIKLKVPVIADAEVGNNWANVSEERYKELLNER